MSRNPCKDHYRQYLGDGVYASFDGWQIWLDTEADGQLHEIALETEVVADLMSYIAQLKKELAAKKVMKEQKEAS